MIYLKRFQLMDEDAYYRALLDLFEYSTPDEYYPIGLFNPNFTGQRIERIDFDDITILYGGNGSGKTTLLNIMAEKLHLFRHREYIRTEAFSFYIERCEYDLAERLAPNSKFLASDDVFDHILGVREDNKGVKSHKSEESGFHKDAKRGYRDCYPGGVRFDFGNPDVRKSVEELGRFNQAQRGKRRQFVRSRAGEMERQYSNGENALMFFDEEIGRNALYLLDEPENSLSPRFQLELKTLIEDSVRYKNCQFIIATHSPFMLSLRDAKIYNLDLPRVSVEKWYELENVKLLYELFRENKEYF